MVGSRNLQNFDPALVIYTFAIIFATWGVIYHYNVWFGKPPTYVYWQRGWKLFGSAGHSQRRHIVGLTGTHTVAQTFIANARGCAGGCTKCSSGDACWRRDHLPAGIRLDSFHQRSERSMTYVTYLFGFSAGQFPLHTLWRCLLFHGLDIAAFLVLGGIALSLWRRMRDEGARACRLSRWISCR